MASAARLAARLGGGNDGSSLKYKAEVVRAANKEPKDNRRFVVTNLKQSPQWTHEEVYCQCGDVENR